MFNGGRGIKDGHALCRQLGALFNCIFLARMQLKCLPPLPFTFVLPLLRPRFHLMLLPWKLHLFAEPELMQSFVMSLLCPCSSNSRHSLCAIEIYCCILQGAYLRFLSSSWNCVCQIFDSITLILCFYCL